MAEPRNRATDKQRAEREAAALQLLSSGAGSAHTAQLLAERYGVSLRTARRYVAAASFMLCDPATPAELDRQAILSLHRLDSIAGRAMLAEDHTLAIQATKAHSMALSAFRRAITAPVTRFRLPTQTDSPVLDDSIPF